MYRPLAGHGARGPRDLFPSVLRVRHIGYYHAYAVTADILVIITDICNFLPFYECAILFIITHML